MTVGEALSSIGTSITSPAKLAYAGYALLAYSEKIKPSLWQFILVTLAFVFIQVVHDDYIRIRLNEKAYREADDERRKAGLTGEARVMRFTSAAAVSYNAAFLIPKPGPGNRCR